MLIYASVCTDGCGHLYIFRGYPPGGFLNMIRQNHPPQPQLHGENFHYVGQSMSFNPMSPPSPSVYGTPSPESENMEANRAAKVNNKRYWTHEEEERLVISVPFYIL
jgi:hypothetical protein